MEFEVHRCPADFVRETVERDHYLERWPDPRSIPFAYCLSMDGKRTAPDGRPFGITVWKKLQHHRQRGLFGSQYVVKISKRFNHRDRWRELGAQLARLGMERPARFNQALRDASGWWRLPTAWQVLDLARVWVHPELQGVKWEGFGRPVPVGVDAAGKIVKGRFPVTHTAAAFSRMVSALTREQKWKAARPDGGTYYARGCELQREWALHHHPPVFPELPYHIEMVVSYCDLGHHDGTGYRASGFERWGWTDDGEKEIYIRRLRPARFEYVPAQQALVPMERSSGRRKAKGKKTARGRATEPVPEPQRGLFEAVA